MVTSSTPPYRFGDLLGLTRQSWLGEMGRRLEARGYLGYRRSDAGALRLLYRGPLAIGQLGTRLGVTRQAARKIAGALERRGYATIGRDQHDSRQLNVTLTAAGQDYTIAIATVIAELNLEVARRVNPEQLAAVDAVLRAALFDDGARERAEGIPRPPSAGPAEP